MIKLNRDIIKDKIHACWIGKNIGGTIGGPYEGKKEYLDITGFTSDKGEPLPNDDLDLQLVWLAALEEVGPSGVNANALATYWQAYIPPYWNEYGISKSNMTGGINPPLSGEYNNEKWRQSNGAWIRSEIWACLAPGYPEIARRYAYYDACVDHGMGEGTVAEQFTATLESLAFFSTDIRDIINKALAAIPADSRVAKAVNLVIDGYDSGKSPRDVREELVKQSEDIGWFQAPANVGYVILGLLYGEGDFKKSLLQAVNCGDDTDCTAGTVGAVLGIMYGTKGIPADWSEYIGDRIVTCSINKANTRINYINSCTVLTDRVMRMIPAMFVANDMQMEFTDGETELEDFEKAHLRRRTIKAFYDADIGKLSRYNLDSYNSPIFRIRTEFDKLPNLEMGDTLEVKFTFFNKLYTPLNTEINLILPCGIDADRETARFFSDNQHEDGDSITFRLTANELFNGNCKVIVEGNIIGFPETVLFAIPITAK